MPAKPQIAIVGPGRLGSTLALELARHGYRVREIVISGRPGSARAARQLAKKVRARTTTSKTACLDADLIWLCVPDRAIAAAARELAAATQWKGRTAFHSSGALASGELTALKRRGSAVASVHPFMTFVRGSAPSLHGVPFGLEGDAAAVRVARRIVRDLGGQVISISEERKVAYHAWGAFASPLLVSLLAAAERVARAAGIPAEAARRKMLPIVRQTVENYAKLGPAGAFSGPVVRGDATIVRQHLRVLHQTPEAREVYQALARAALRYLPVQNRRELRRILRK